MVGHAPKSDDPAGEGSLQLGQHLLRDPESISAVVDAIALNEDDVVFEPGSGKGALTIPLSRRAKVVAVDIDPTMALEVPGVEFVNGDALDVMQRVHFTVLVGNIPFQMAEPLMKRMLRISSCRAASLVLPETFAKALQGPTTLGNCARALFTVEILREIPRSAFYPPPDTAVVLARMIRREPASRDNLERAIASLVEQSDKKVKNALERHLEGVKTKREVRSWAESIGDAAGKGIFSLSNQEFAALLAALPRIV